MAQIQTDQEKIILLRPWLLLIIKRIKKNLQEEHLAKDALFCSKYFGDRAWHLITLPQMVWAYTQEIEAGNCALAEFIGNRWVLKNEEMYRFFERKLQVLTSDFEQLSTLDEDFSRKLMEESVKEFGAVRTYIFVIFNSVVFPDTILSTLRSYAERER